MFKNKQIKYLIIRKDGLYVKYFGEKSEKFLTNNRVNFKNWFETQGKYYQKAKDETIQKTKGWEERHQNYLKRSFPRI